MSVVGETEVLVMYVKSELLQELYGKRKIYYKFGDVGKDSKGKIRE